jgi:hypothetical protein
MAIIQFQLPQNYRKVSYAVPDGKYQKLKEYLVRKGISVYEDLPFGIAFTTFKGRFEIHVNPNAAIGPVLEHEVLHILRGDFFVRDRILELWNAASDVVINEICGLTKDSRTAELTGNPEFVYLGIPEDELKKIIEEIEKETGEKFVLKLFDSSILPPEISWKNGAGPIYEWLLKQKGQKGQRKLRFTCYQQLNENDEQARKEWERVKKEIIKDLLNDGDMPPDLKETIKKELLQRFEQLAKGPRHVGRRDSEFEGYVIEVEPTHNRVLDEILKLANSMEVEEDLNTILQRSYHREGRLEELPREIDVPTLSILFVIDVSGSMDSVIHEVASAVRYCQLNYQIDRIFFSDGAKFVAGDDVRFYGASCGTNYGSALDLMRRMGKRWDIIVLITDYEFFSDDLARLREIEKYGRAVIYFNENLEKIDVKKKGKVRR